jgi:hypothetical protein
MQAKIIGHIVLAKHYNLTLLRLMFIIMATAWLDQSSSKLVSPSNNLHALQDGFLEI